MKNKIIDLLHIALIVVVLAAAYLLVSCTPDRPAIGPEPSSARLVRVKVSLSALSAGSGASSDASGSSSRAVTSDPDDDDNAVTGEEMRNWFVVIVQNGKVVELVKSDTFSDGEGEKDEDDFFVNIPASEQGIPTTFYSFANIQPSEVGLDNLQSGDAFPADFDAKTYRVDGNLGLFADHMTDLIPRFKNGIPMSNKQTVNITEDTQYINLEVIRMLAKVKLQVQNVTGHTIKLVGLTLSDVTPNSSELLGESNNLKLLPGKSDEADKQVIETNLNTAEKQVMSLTAMHDNNGYGYNIAPGESQDICFYMNESEATEENKYFVLQLQTEDNDNTATKVNRRLAMLDWRKICRNDYRIIPIQLSDYSIEWEVEAFTPIGVLPEVEDDGKNLTLTMGYYGEFHIAPVVRELSTGYKAEVLNGSFAWVAGSKDMFDVAPVWNQAGKRVEGEMANQGGTSIYSLTMTARKPFGSEQITLTRKVRFVMNPVNLSKRKEE